jgi:benzylsuccinate CoA-transferase BbsF subunit
MSDSPDLPLAGVRVLDLTTTIAGPSATRVLADFGAMVIKVESETHPDTARLSSPFAGGERGLNSSGYFSAYNAGKLSVSVNLRAPGGRDALRHLVNHADALVESFAPGVMERLGLSDNVLREWNPQLIIAHHSLQGQTGPRSRQRGYGQLASAMTGWFEITGHPDEDPVGPYSAFTDFIAWPILASSIVLALEVRDAGGNPLVIDHSHVESSAYFAAPELLAAQRERPVERAGNSESYAFPSDAFPCLGDDEWCALSIEDDGAWAALVTALDYSALQDARFATDAGRREHGTALLRALQETTSALDAEVLEARLRTAQVPGGRVYKAEDLFQDDQLAARRAFRRLEHPVLGEHAVVAPAFAIREVDSGPNEAFPLLGADTEDVFREVCGLSAEEIAELAAQGAFQ